MTHLSPGGPGMLNQLFFQVNVADNGTGHQLGKEGKIDAEDDR